MVYPKNMKAVPRIKEVFTTPLQLERKNEEIDFIFLCVVRVYSKLMVKTDICIP